MVGKSKPPGMPERDVFHRQLGEVATELLTEYAKKGGDKSGSGRRRLIIKGAALALLRATEAPPSLIELFDVMLGDVASKLPDRVPKSAWIYHIADYEARAHQVDREVTNAELADNVVMPGGFLGGDRNHVIRRLRQTRDSSWYPALVLGRRVYLIDNSKSV